MSKINREQIIEALERCLTLEYGVACKGCPLSYNDERRTDCLETLMKNALSLIKELTEENERLKASKYMAYPDGRLELIPSIESVKADTVRKMQERVKQAICDNTYPDFDKNGKPVNVWQAISGYDLIDQIAKEMLKEDKNND